MHPSDTAGPCSPRYSAGSPLRSPHRPPSPACFCTTSRWRASPRRPLDCTLRSGWAPRRRPPSPARKSQLRGHLRRCSYFDRRGALCQGKHRKKAPVEISRPGLDSCCSKCHSLSYSVGCDKRLLHQSSIESQRYARRLPMEPLHRRRRAIVLRINAGKQFVRGRGATTHHAACLQSLARVDEHSWKPTDTAGRPKSRQCCEEENNTGGKATKPAHSLLRSHNKSTYFPKLCNAAGVGAATPTGVRNVTHGAGVQRS